MAPVKPMGTHDSNMGVGFPQKYNEREAPRQELDPAATGEPVSPAAPTRTAKAAAPKAKRAAKKR